MIRMFLASLLFVSFAQADDAVPPAKVAGVEIRLPVIDIPAPMPTSPTAVTRLSANQLYVIDSDVALQVVASKDGFVTISEEAGPLKIKGVFVDDPSGKAKTRTFKGPFLYTVEVVNSGQIELLIFKDVKTPAIRRTIDVDAGQGPVPPTLPTDEFVAALKAAFATESVSEQAYLTPLRSLYAKSAGFADDANNTTWGKVYEAMGAEAKASKLAGHLAKLQAPIGRYLETVAPPGDNSDVAFSPSDRAKLKLAFAKITAALGAIK